MGICEGGSEGLTIPAGWRAAEWAIMPAIALHCMTAQLFASPSPSLYHLAELSALQVCVLMLLVAQCKGCRSQQLIA